MLQNLIRLDHKDKQKSIHLVEFGQVYAQAVQF